MNKVFKTITSLIFIVTLFFLVSTSSVTANTILDGLTKTVKGTELEGGKTNLPLLIGEIIQILLGFLGVIAVVLIIFAGFMWMTAGGDTAKIDKAKAYIKNAVIGMVIILTSYIIASYVLKQISSTIK